MKKMILIVLSIILLIVGGFLLFLHFLFKEEDRYLGRINPNCDKNIGIDIFHYSEFDWIQPISFQIVRNDRMLIERTVFAGTNDRNEGIDCLDVHCFNNIIYLTFKNEEEILMIYDMRSNLSFPKPSNRTVDYDEWRLRDSLIAVVKNSNVSL